MQNLHIKDKYFTSSTLCALYCTVHWFINSLHIIGEVHFLKLTTHAIAMISKLSVKILWDTRTIYCTVYKDILWLTI